MITQKEFIIICSPYRFPVLDIHNLMMRLNDNAEDLLSLDVFYIQQLHKACVSRKIPILVNVMKRIDKIRNNPNEFAKR